MARKRVKTYSAKVFTGGDVAEFSGLVRGNVWIRDGALIISEATRLRAFAPGEWVEFSMKEEN